MEWRYWFRSRVLDGQHSGYTGFSNLYAPQYYISFVCIKSFIHNLSHFDCLKNRNYTWKKKQKGTSISEIRHLPLRMQEDLCDLRILVLILCRNKLDIWFFLYQLIERTRDPALRLRRKVSKNEKSFTSEYYPT
jgi:hypothetical protein